MILHTASLRMTDDRPTDLVDAKRAERKRRARARVNEQHLAVENQTVRVGKRFRYELLEVVHLIDRTYNLYADVQLEEL